MSKRKDPLLQALEEGRSYTWTVPDGGDLASMRAAIKHGQTLTMSPIADPQEIRAGDIVLVKWHRTDMMHLVQEIQGDQFLIANSVGKINGWVGASDILGRITRIVEPEPRPEVPAMLEQLEAACRRLIECQQAAQDEARRLLSVVDDLRWYADRIGAERWDRQPRQNKWSFAQNVWHLSKQASKATETTQPICHWIDRGKACVGLAAEIVALFEGDEAE